MDRGKLLSKLFSFYPWPSDPDSEEGKEYFARAISTMNRVCKYLLEEGLLEKRGVRILEICGGTGFGGVALAKALKGMGKEIDLLITDLRKDALRTARKLALSVLKQDVHTRQLDALRIPEVGQTFDIVLLYGLSTPHFSPWDMAKVFAGATEVLGDDGIFLIEEADRVYTIFYLIGYKRMILESPATSDKLVMSVHVDYDPKTGFFRRRIFDLRDKENDVTMDVYFWGIAGLLSLGWLFFEHVDALELDGASRYMCVLARPRRKVRFWDLKTPRILEGRK